MKRQEGFQPSGREEALGPPGRETPTPGSALQAPVIREAVWMS